MLRFFKIVMLFTFFITIFLCGTKKVQAADTKTDYIVEYFVQDNNNSVTTNVQFTIAITNLKTALYVKKISLGFPNSFSITNLNAKDDLGPIEPKLLSEGSQYKMNLEFTDPAVGQNSVNRFFIDFTQGNLFKVTGNVWEVILPTIEDQTKSSYKIIIHLPPNSKKKIAIAKPLPTTIVDNEITWDNPTEKTIYAIFGNEQYYSLNLQYHLDNPQLIPVYTDVAFPPDTEYQKTFVESISPMPERIFTDEDGNYMGRYILSPKQKINITYKGSTELFVQPRTELKTYIKDQFNQQKKYLLTAQKYWQLSNIDLSSYNTPADIFNFDVHKLSYDYDKLNKESVRLGAQEALKNPSTAVCTEFSDTFVAIARAKGIYSREIQGYGFAQEGKLRPVSLASDVLHSWVEYYDTENDMWIPLDPTWQNTSGIDYLNSFDLNHITFAIHGKESDYPYPAGSYKTNNDSHDISISTTSTKPEEQINLTLVPPSFPNQMVDNKPYKTKISVTNKGNTFMWNIPIDISSDNLKFSSPTYTIESIAPFETKSVDVEYNAITKNKKIPAKISISISGNEIYNTTVTILPYYYTIGIKIGYITGIVILIVSFFFLIRRFVFRRF